MLTKEKVSAVQADIAAALKAVAAKHGMNTSNTKISYTTETFKLTVEFGDLAVTGGADPKYLINMKKYGWNYDLEAADINKVFDIHTLGQVQLLGMSGMKKVVLKQVSSGKMYAFDAEGIKARLPAYVTAP